MKIKDKKIWLKEPESHDYPAALDYLELLYTHGVADAYVRLLQSTQTVSKKAKDILRASKLPLLPKSNTHVKANIKKVKKGKER